MPQGSNVNHNYLVLTRFQNLIYNFKIKPLLNLGYSFYSRLSGTAGTLGKKATRNWPFLGRGFILRLL